MFFISPWATKSCSGFCHVWIFTYLLMCVYLCGGKERIFDDMNVTSTKLLCRDWKPVNLDCVPPAESRPLCSSSPLFLQNGLRRHVGTYWTFIQTTILMPTCSRQTLVKDHAFLVKKNKLTLLKLTLIDRRLNVIAKITFQEIAQLQNYRNSAMSISVYSVFFRRGISLYLLIERIFFILYIIYI